MSNDLKLEAELNRTSTRMSWPNESACSYDDLEPEIIGGRVMNINCTQHGWSSILSLTKLI